MFIGHYYHALEQKGRLAIPAAFRKELGKQAVITRGLDGCLFIFPEGHWQKVISEADSQPFTKESARNWVRLLTNNAQLIEFDGQGRILVPTHLKEFAKLTNNCVIAGSLNRLEVWDRKTFEKYSQKLEAKAEEIAESLTKTKEI